MVAALALQADQPGLRVGILDYDYHYGGGTDDIIRRLQSCDVTHISAGLSWTRRAQAAAFLDHIAEDLQQMKRCDVVLYQAGADPHVDDPLGGFLTTSEMTLRDRYVFEGLAARRIPVAWNLAGGYQHPLANVVELHVNTMRVCIASSLVG